MYLEEAVGFEPTEVLPPLVFKTNRLSRSRTLPYIILEETTGFEPVEPLRAHNLSRVAVSTTHTNLLK